MGGRYPQVGYVRPLRLCAERGAVASCLRPRYPELRFVRLWSVCVCAGKWQREQTSADPLRGRTTRFDTLLVGTEVGVLVDKTSEAMAAVENRDQFHGAEAPGGESLP